MSDATPTDQPNASEERASTSKSISEQEPQQKPEVGSKPQDEQLEDTKPLTPSQAESHQSPLPPSDSHQPVANEQNDETPVIKSGTRLNHYERVIFFACLNVAWKMLGYPRGKFDKNVHKLTVEEAQTWGIPRGISAHSLKGIWNNFMANKTIDGGRTGGRKCKDIEKEVELLLSEPDMSFRKAARELTKAGIACSTSTVWHRAKQIKKKNRSKAKS